MHKEKSCTVVHYFASAETIQQLILWRRKKKIMEIQKYFLFHVQELQLEKISKAPERASTTIAT